VRTRFESSCQTLGRSCSHSSLKTTVAISVSSSARSPSNSRKPSCVLNPATSRKPSHRTPRPLKSSSPLTYRYLHPGSLLLKHPQMFLWLHYRNRSLRNARLLSHNKVPRGGIVAEGAARGHDQQGGAVRHLHPHATCP
jgi:hypothetical protein